MATSMMSGRVAATSSLNITRISSKAARQIFWLPFRAFCVSVLMSPASSRIWRLEETVDCGSFEQVCDVVDVEAAPQMKRSQDLDAHRRSEAAQYIGALLRLISNT